MKFKTPNNSVITDNHDCYAAKQTLGKGSWAKTLPFISERRSVIDVGAHVGISTVWWLENEFNHVYTFELNPTHYECLLENTITFKEKITYYPYGCSNVSSEGYGFYQSGKTSGSFQICDKNKEHTLKDPNKFKIETKRIDDFVYDSVSLIKIDVQGWEYEVLDGAEQTINEHQPLLFVEFMGGSHAKSRHQYDVNKYHELLKKLDYIKVAEVPDSIYIHTSKV